jgi:transmembrane sensor
MSRPRLPLPLAKLIDQRAPQRAPQMWRAIRARARGRRTHAGRRLLVAALAASLLAALAWLGSPGQFAVAPAGGLRLADGSVLPARVEPLADYAALDLSDGSRVTVAQHARLDVLETSGRAVLLALRSGRVRFDVRPHGPRSWRIECGALAVEVVGTAFVIERTRGALQVAVLRGAVLVRGESVPDGVQRLNGGQQLRVPSGASAASALAAGSAPPVALAPEGVEDHALTPEVAARERAAALPPTQQPAAGAAAPAESVAPRPGRAARRELAGAEVIDIEALLREADALRLAGRPAAAVAPLTRVIEARPADARTGLAAFALARLHLGALADPSAASRDLERALALGLPLGLQEDAYVKLAEAHERAGDWPGSCAALARYAERFPRGTKAEPQRQRCRLEREP